MRQATFVVLDGADGTGKDTQAPLLVEAAKQRGLRVAYFEFPDYTTPTGKEILAYKQGKYGELTDANPWFVGYPFAVNRFEVQPRLAAAISDHDLVLAKRYVPSNIAYTAALLPRDQRAELRHWLEKLDYEILGNPREDAVLFLDMPLEISDRLIRQRKLGRRDLHDENRSYREQVLSEYHTLASSRPNWHVVNCVSDDGELRSIDSIAQELEVVLFERILSQSRLKEQVAT